MDHYGNHNRATKKHQQDLFAIVNSTNGYQIAMETKWICCRLVCLVALARFHFDPVTLTSGIRGRAFIVRWGSRHKDICCTKLCYSLEAWFPYLDKCVHTTNEDRRRDSIESKTKTLMVFEWATKLQCCCSAATFLALINCITCTWVFTWSPWTYSSKLIQ